MSGIINLIKNLVGGIFGFLGGLFNKKAALEGDSKQATKKKNSGYFLELDDSKVASTTGAALAAVTEAVSTVAIATSDNGKESTQPKKTTRKEKLAAAKAANGASAEKSSAPSESTPVAAIVSAPVSEVGFATKYPIQVSSGGRRRPGANMTSYLDMARQMK